jgi:hypothetical protein
MCHRAWSNAHNFFGMEGEGVQPINETEAKEAVAEDEDDKDNTVEV